MRNTGILLLIIGAFLIINAGSFRDLVLGKAKLNFVNPKTASSSTKSNPKATASSSNNSSSSSSSSGGRVSGGGTF